MRSVHHERASYPIICTHGVGEIGPLSSGCSFVGVLIHRGPRCPIGLPMLHREGRVSYCRHSWQDTPSLPLHVHPVSPLGNIDYLSLSSIGGRGLWSREGCGAGPNVHSIVTSVRASATAGIPDRMTPCPALLLYPGLQTSVFSSTYM